MCYAEIILPLAVGHSFTYYIPPEFEDEILPGIRVEVNFGRKKHYAGVVLSLHNKNPQNAPAKPIIAVLDEYPVVTNMQLEHWIWMSEYYMHHLGEIMAAALPPAMKLSSETRVLASAKFESADEDLLNNDEYAIRELLKIKQECGLDDLSTIIQDHAPRKLIRKLIEREYLIVYEQLEREITERKKEIILLDPAVLNEKEQQMEWFEKLNRSKHQTNALMGILFLSKKHPFVLWEELKNRFNIPRSAIKTLEKKGLIELHEMGLSEMMENELHADLEPLSEIQQAVYDKMDAQWNDRDIFLLHGVTGSGKTHIYAHKMVEILDEDPQAQVLFLLPEIALTTLTLARIKKLFGDDVLIYHSRLSPQERMTAWYKVLKGQRIILGPRSALFLPFQKLQLLIIDEEHDSSYEQNIRRPFYQGRDAAIVMAKIHKAKIILGSATPSLTSLWKAKNNKFSYLQLLERHGRSELPDISLINIKKARDEKQMQGHFSRPLIDAINKELYEKKQVLLFQNRRGHSPIYLCTTCDWRAMCSNCDIALTYHQHFEKMICHLCNFSYPFVQQCPVCGSSQLEKIGLGTERIEEEVQELFPNIPVARLDLDTASKKHSAQEILEDFQNNKTKILIGTQMITKGLDFNHIGLVGILLADTLLYFPEYRATERAFQLMLQVAGRAGRREEKGKVLIQTLNPGHPIFGHIKHQNYHSFAQAEWIERQKFKYPPFVRLIKIVLKHKNPKQVQQAAQLLGARIKAISGIILMGPSEPGIARIRNQYLRQMLVKMPLKKSLIDRTKKKILYEIDQLQSTKGMSAVRIEVHVDS